MKAKSAAESRVDKGVLPECDPVAVVIQYEATISWHGAGILLGGTGFVEIRSGLK